jgi:hypothetical protein
MITQLGLRNFKAWEKFGPAPLAPLTVLFGANSSGKSSIAQMLLMLKQTAESSDRKMIFNTGSAKTAVDLGNFYEMVFEHDEKRRIGVDITWSLPKPLTLVDSYARKDYTAASIRFEAEVGLGGKLPVPCVERLQYTFGDARSEGFAAGMRRSDKAGGRYELTQGNYKFMRNPGRKWPVTEPVKCYGFPDEVVNYYQNADVVKALNLSFEKLFQEVFYLGPLRERLIRQYTWTGESPEHVGWKGESAVVAILAAQGRFLYRG